MRMVVVMVEMGIAMMMTRIQGSVYAVAGRSRSSSFDRSRSRIICRALGTRLPVLASGFTSYTVKYAIAEHAACVGA
jgi:putative Mn2+ efflux pump MntP